MRLVLTCGLLAAACLGAAAQQPERCTVEGRVVKAGTGEPLNRARIILRKTDARDVSYSASTGESGRFFIQDVQPGRYRLSAERNGYLRTNYGQRRANQAGAVLTLSPGQRAGDIVLNLVPFGVISGRVVDEAGEPVPRVRVTALRSSRESGRRQLVAAVTDASDDRGEYRIFGLAPGKYYVSAAPSPTPGGMMGEDEGEQYVPFFYPGVTEPGQAAPLEVPGGREINSVDFRLIRMPTVRVRGKVVPAATGSRLDRDIPIVVFLMPRSEMFSSRVLNATAGPDGNFDIRSVGPGSYVLTAFQANEQRRLFARLPIEVGGSTIDGVNLVLIPGLEVTGRVRLEGGEVEVKDIRILLQSRNGSIGGSGGVAPVKPDGTFALQNVAADDYQFSVLGLSGDAYLKAARIGGMDILAGGVDLSRGNVPGPLDVLVSYAGGHVEGTVSGDDQQPAAGATVVLVPEGERRSRPELFRSTSSDDSGRFVLRGIPPGDYQVFAWEDVEQGAWLDTDFLRDYERSGEALSISERGRINLQLKVIPAGKGGSS
jgi:hypothetical protein